MAKDLERYMREIEGRVTSLEHELDYVGGKVSDKPTKDEGLAKWPVEDWHPVSRKDVDLLLLEVRDLVASVGELRISLDAMWRQVVRQQELINELAEDVKTLRAGWINDAGRSANIDAKITKELKELWKLGMEHDLRLQKLENAQPKRTLTGTIQGLEGEFTVTPPPEWERT